MRFPLKKLFFREEYNEDLHIVISDAKKSIKNHQRFIIVTNYRTFLAVDTKLNTSLDILLKDLPKHYDFSCRGQVLRNLSMKMKTQQI